MQTNGHSENDKQQLNMWYCRDCNTVHFRVGAVMLNFTREEFGFVSELLSEKLRNNEEDVLSSELIS